jgi:hypothetical protein
MANPVPPNPPYYPPSSPNPYNGGVCRLDTPYPSVSQESVPSLINNLTTALYGTISKVVANRQVVWNIPCDPNNTATIASVPRNTGEGLLCYLLRIFYTYDPGSYTNLTTAQTLTNKTISGGILSGITTFPNGTIDSNGNINTTGSITASGGFIGSLNGNATSATTATSATSFIGNLFGDVTGIQSITSVVRVNGASIPTSKTIVGTNSSGQIIDASSATLANSISGNAATATTATNATNIANGVAGQIPYQSGTNTTSFIANGTSGQFLQSNGTSAPTWVSPSISTANNINGGLAGEVVYQSASGTTSFTAVGTAGQLLVSNGSSSPIWSVDHTGISAATGSYPVSASAGYVGETLFYTNAFTNLTSGATSQILNITNTSNPSLTAGDYQFWGTILIQFNNVTLAAGQNIQGCISATNGSLDFQKRFVFPFFSALSGSTIFFQQPLSLVNILQPGGGTPASVWVNVSAPTFSAGTISVTPYIYARRMR